MNATDTSQWRHTSPLAVIFYLGKIYKTIAENAVQSLAPLVAFLFAYQGGLMGKLILGGGAFITFTVVAAILRYWFFRYRIDEGSILIREGVINKTQVENRAVDPRAWAWTRAMCASLWSAMYSCVLRTTSELRTS